MKLIKTLTKIRKKSDNEIPLTIDNYDWVYFNETSFLLEDFGLYVDIDRTFNDYRPPAFWVRSGTSYSYKRAGSTYLFIQAAPDFNHIANHDRVGRYQACIFWDRRNSVCRIVVKGKSVLLRPRRIAITSRSYGSPSVKLTVPLTGLTLLPSETRQFIRSTKINGR